MRDSSRCTKTASELMFHLYRTIRHELSVLYNHDRCERVLVNALVVYVQHHWYRDTVLLCTHLAVHRRGLRLCVGFFRNKPPSHTPARLVALHDDGEMTQ